MLLDVERPERLVPKDAEVQHLPQEQGREPGAPAWSCGLEVESAPGAMRPDWSKPWAKEEEAEPKEAESEL